jgi:two-component system invasion response regulator UvrY
MIVNVKILLVDAHPILRLGLRQTIALQPHLSVVGEASTGELALKLALELKPDVMVMELSLPGMSGLEAIRQILSALPGTKIIIYSGATSRTQAREAIRAGACGYLSKGGSSEGLFCAINLVMEGKRYLSPETDFGILEDDQKTPPEDCSPRSFLSERDKRLLRLIAEGRRSKEIASHLALRPQTVDNYRSRLMRRLSCGCATELVRYAIREKIVDA